MRSEYYAFADLGYLYAALVIALAVCLYAAVAIIRSEERE